MARNKRSTSDRHYETATEAHVAGMELYKEKKYHDALRAFNSVRLAFVFPFWSILLTDRVS